MKSGYYFIKLHTNVALPMYVICLDERMYIWQNGKQQWLQLGKEQIVSERLTFRGEK
jgi:hypothetical protein